MTHDGATLTGANVLSNEAGDAVAVNVNDNYYNLSDVENNGSDDGFVVKEGTSEYGAGAAMIDDETVTKGIDISSQASTDASITTLDNAIQSVSAERAKLGAVQNRLDHTINNLGASSET
ncbi:Putative flagellin YvzB [Halobacillus karajensis]|uniref:Flagellin YvzB n=1 Tax=Halobacillus karajensis TaxID=195088 RepID=A0A024P3B1_9BACI|nr:Putative flagellin YvzB [Halobacillus karajensis]CDQ22112.1 Putative flagellin YvzB [Halobacillus karajensis]CDQ27953.1 Putative flagellin YvzB [Halobacillus karajensis]